MTATLSTTDFEALKAVVPEERASKALNDFIKGPYRTVRFTARFPRARPTQPSVYLGYRKVSQYHPLWGRLANTASNNAVREAFESLLRSHLRVIQLHDSFGTVDLATQSSIAAVTNDQFMTPSPGKRGLYNEIRDDVSYIMEGIGGEIQPASGASNESGENNLQLRTEVEHSYTLPLTSQGDGAQRVFLILHHLVNAREPLIAVEEPEICLHSGAQRRFRSVIDHLSTKYQRQVVISTHSSVFLDGWQASAIYSVGITEGNSTIAEISGRESALEAARALGVNPGDALAADGIVWVEGPSDAVVYKRLLGLLGVDLDSLNVSVMWGGGDAIRHLTASDLSKLNPNFVVFLDSDKTSPRKAPAPWKTAMAKDCRAVNAQAFITGRRELENYFSSNAVGRHYGVAGLPQVDPYDDFDDYISNNITGRKYLKGRDADPIAARMTASEVEQLDDLTEALREVQRRIGVWKNQT